MSRTRRRKTPVGIALVGAALIGVAVVGWNLIGDEPAADAPADGVAATSTAPYTVKAEPSEVAVDAPVEVTGGHVDVVITFAGFDEAAGTVQANGLVTGVLEEGGTCTLTMTGAGSEVTAVSTAAADASSTTCGLLETETGLAPGTWNAVLTYDSDRAHGESEAVEVLVP